MSPPIYTPDGSEVREIVLPDGSTASEVIGPDGNVVFEAEPDIPDSVVYLYEFEDTLSDSTDSNPLSIAAGSPTFDPDAAVGSKALNHDGDDGTVSDNSFDPSLGTTSGFGLIAQLKPASTSPNDMVGIGRANDSTFGIRANSGAYELFLQIQGSNQTVTSSVSIDTSAYQSVYIEATDSQLTIDVDGTEDTASQSNTLSNITALDGDLFARTGNRGDQADYAYNGLVDDYAICIDPLTDDELSQLRSRA